MGRIRRSSPDPISSLNILEQNGFRFRQEATRMRATPKLLANTAVGRLVAQLSTRREVKRRAIGLVESLVKEELTSSFACGILTSDANATTRYRE
jgi:hypothetical protein